MNIPYLQKVCYRVTKWESISKLKYYTNYKGTYPLSLVPFGSTFSTPPSNMQRRAFLMYSWPWILGARDFESNSNTSSPWKIRCIAEWIVWYCNLKRFEFQYLINILWNKSKFSHNKNTTGPLPSVWRISCTCRHHLLKCGEKLLCSWGLYCWQWGWYGMYHWWTLPAYWADNDRCQQSDSREKGEFIINIPFITESQVAVSWRSKF